MLQISLKITHLALLNLIKGFRHIDIKRWKKSWLCLYPKLLQFFTIQIEILLAKRPHSHYLHLSFHQIDDHRQFIEPSLSQEPSPFGHSIVVIEFATHIQVVVLIDIGLQIFRIGIHRPELEHIKHPAPFPILLNRINTP